jgi:hypothetical protein
LLYGGLFRETKKGVGGRGDVARGLLRLPASNAVEG